MFIRVVAHYFLSSKKQSKLISRTTHSLEPLYAIPPVSREKLTSQANVNEVDFREKILNRNKLTIKHLQKR